MPGCGALLTWTRIDTERETLHAEGYVLTDCGIDAIPIGDVEMRQIVLDED